MDGASFSVAVPGGELGGRRRGSGEPVLLLHGGPGLGYEYLVNVFERELAGFDVATYQQRGLAPSTLAGPFTVERSAEDALAVLDGLGWERAWLAGHAWGGVLLLALMARAPDRVLGGLAIEPMGVFGDGGFAAVNDAMRARLPHEDWIRAERIDARVWTGEATQEEFEEAWRLIFPAFFSSLLDLPMLPDPLRVSRDAYLGINASMPPSLPELAAALPGIRAPLGCVVGADSPLPAEDGGAAIAAAVPGGWLEVVPEAAHFPWYERPGCVAAAMHRLTTPAGGSG